MFRTLSGLPSGVLKTVVAATGACHFLSKYTEYVMILVVNFFLLKKGILFKPKVWKLRREARMNCSSVPCRGAT